MTSVPWVVDHDGSPVDEDLTRVGGVGAGERVHQRGLAGAVPADQRNDLASVEIHRHVVNGMEAAEGDADVLEFAQRGAASVDL